jgi:ubiquinone/menaquinone biosynthesis C-methylase UbiE
MNAPQRSDGTDGVQDAETREGMSAEDVADAYDDIADSLDRWSWMDRLFAGRYRRRQFGDASGRVLDVACGTGPNFRYLPPSVDVVGIDISPEMLEKAEARLESLPPEGSVVEMDAEALAFPDDSFETVISSFSTCTFPNPLTALREMRRVCAPTGRILLLEHGQSENRVLARLMDWRADAHYEKAGCRLTQRPLELVDEAGLSVRDAREEWFGILTLVEATPG